MTIQERINYYRGSVGLVVGAVLTVLVAVLGALGFETECVGVPLDEPLTQSAPD